MSWFLGGDLGAGGGVEWAAPQWQILLAVAAALVIWALAWPGARSIGARALELGLWALALAAVVVGIARPTWVEESGRTESGRLAVLVDASRSMATLENGQPRSEQVQAVLDKLGPSAEVFHFGADLAVGRPVGYHLGGTDIEGALDALGERYAGESLSGVVVLSDGLDRGLLRRRYQREDNPKPPELLGPLTVYGIGTPGALRDIAVRDVDAGGFAFHQEPFRVRATLSHTGFAGTTISAQLSRDGTPVTQRQVTLDDTGTSSVEFQVKPNKVGRFNYTVSVPVYDGDAVPANNEAPVVVRVVRQQIRVLQVAGSPSWDVKFLRRFLKGDPSVDLVSFFILRTPDDTKIRFERGELSLIEFPYEDLFSTELQNFDLVIFQNFDHRTFFDLQSERLLDNIRRYVEDEGNAFVMIGGDRSFDLGDYSDTPIESLLPLRLGVQGARANEASFSPVLTEQGERHPITRLSTQPADNAQWWKRLAPAAGANQSLGLAAGATSLLDHPTARTPSGQPQPVLAVKEAGRGRSMALTIDSSWRWSFQEAAAGRGNQAYLRFWKNAFRWLMNDPEAQRFTVDTPRENYGLDEPIRVVVRAKDVGFEPLVGADVRVEVTVGGATRELVGTTDEGGEVVLLLEDAEPGAHRVVAHVGVDGLPVGKAETVFAVTARDPELEEVIPDEAFLRWLAESTDGRFVPAGEWGAPVTDPDAGRVVMDRREVPLSRAPLLALWMALFAGLAWIVRRRAGLR